MKSNNNMLIEKWAKVLDHEDLPAIADRHRRATVAQLIENQVNDGQSVDTRGFLSEALPSNHSADFGGPNSNNTTNVSGYDPILVSLVRRAMPNLIAYETVGVQPMTGPTGLIFAMRSKYADPDTKPDLLDDDEAFYNEADSAYSGTGDQEGETPSVLNDSPAGDYTHGTGVNTVTGEDLGGATAFGKMGFTIEKVSVTAKTRGLEAEYTVELAQDLRQIHGLDAETELANILTSEIMANINREVIRTVYVSAIPGAANTAVAGTFDLDADSNGRWSVEKFKGLMFQIERDANAVAKATRRGRGNFIICSSDVASALSAAGELDVPLDPSRGRMEIDDTGNTFVGILNGRYRVYIDPYAPVSANGDGNFYVVGYRGASPMDAGIFYCPYVPLQMFRVVDPETYQPKIAFKTRYGMVANPYAEGETVGLGVIKANSNVYYRRVKVVNLEGAAS